MIIYACPWRARRSPPGGRPGADAWSFGIRYRVSTGSAASRRDECDRGQGRAVEIGRVAAPRDLGRARRWLLAAEPSAASPRCATTAPRLGRVPARYRRAPGARQTREGVVGRSGTGAVRRRPQAMTGLVAGLERQGYITRKPLVSSRVIEATVTPLGKKVHDEAKPRGADRRARDASSLRAGAAGSSAPRWSQCDRQRSNAAPAATLEFPTELRTVRGSPAAEDGAGRDRGRGRM